MKPVVEEYAFIRERMERLRKDKEAEIAGVPEEVEKPAVETSEAEPVPNEFIYSLPFNIAP